MARGIALTLLLALAACEGGSDAERVQLIPVPEQWAAQDVIVMEVEWHAVDPDNLPVECGDTAAAGCTVYGSGWADNGRCAIAAADPRHWDETSEMGLRRHRTLAHELLHCAYGSFHD